MIANNKFQNANSGTHYVQDKMLEAGIVWWT